LHPDAINAVRVDTVVESFERTLVAVEALVAAVPPAQLGQLTRCPGWDVRAVVNHLIFENLAHAALASGDTIPTPDATTDYIGGDHVAAYRRSAESARAALSRPGLLEQRFGPAEAPGFLIVQQAINEQLAHGWDLATATGQPTDFVPDVAEDALAVLRVWLREAPRGPGCGYDPEQPAPAGATPADRLAAYLGRPVS
jgi:uncharacterized protein (TIGR03086 family)